MNPFLNSILYSLLITKEVTGVGDTLAYTWFGRPNYAYSETANKYWIGSTKNTPDGTTQHITEYDITENVYSSTKLGTKYVKDDHNQAQILIRESDGRLIVFYTEHVGLTVRYRVSTNPLDSSSFGNEEIISDSPASSYASPYQASNGDIFVFWRYTPGTIQEEWYYSKSTDEGITFLAPIKLYKTGRRAYLITNQLDDTIHFIANDAHPQINYSVNASVYHFKFDLINEVAYDSYDNVIVLPLIPSVITPIYTPINYDTSWILDITFKNNLPRVLYLNYPDGLTSDYLNKELWFAEFNGTQWINKQKIATVMIGYIETDETIGELAYTGASRFSVSNPDIIWMPKQVLNEENKLVLEIHKVDISTPIIFIKQLTFNSAVNNWRPISLDSSKNNLLWLRNNVYNSFQDYDITLMTTTINV